MAYTRDRGDLPIVPHEFVGGQDCCGCIVAVFRGGVADLVCKNATLSLRRSLALTSRASYQQCSSPKKTSRAQCVRTAEPSTLFSASRNPLVHLLRVCCACCRKRMTLTCPGGAQRSICRRAGRRYHFRRARQLAHDCTLACVKNGSKFVFVSEGKVYPIANQDLGDLRTHAGHDVKVTGNLSSDGKTITVSKVEMTH
jgi:hypothetical protein